MVGVSLKCLIAPCAHPPSFTVYVRPQLEKRTNLKKPNSERTGHGLRVKFNPLALLLDASLEGEFDLVQRIIYEVSVGSLHMISHLTNTQRAGECSGQGLIFSDRAACD